MHSEKDVQCQSAGSYYPAFENSTHRCISYRGYAMRKRKAVISRASFFFSLAVLLALSGVVQGTAQAQDARGKGDERDRPSRSQTVVPKVAPITREAIKLPSNRIQAFKQFNDRYNGHWRIEWDQKLGNVKRLYGFHSEPSDLSSEQIVDNFLAGQKDLFNIQTADFQLEKKQRLNTKLFQSYQQVYRGIPVHSGMMKVLLSNRGEILSVSLQHFPVGEISVVPRLSERDAFESALRFQEKDPKRKSGLVQLGTGSLVVFPKPTETAFEYRLAWTIDLAVDVTKPFMRAFVDATSGEVLKGEPLLINEMSAYPSQEYNSVGNLGTTPPDSTRPLSRIAIPVSAKPRQITESQGRTNTAATILSVHTTSCPVDDRRDTSVVSGKKGPPPLPQSDNSAFRRSSAKPGPAAPASTTIFYDDFSSSYPGEWSIGHDGGSGSYSWAWAYGYAHCYTDPSGGQYYYPDNLKVYMERRGVSLAGCASATLSFYKIVDTEASFDQFTVNVRDQSGAWHLIYSQSGMSDPLAWEYIELNLDAFAGQTGLYIQFRFDSDGSVSGDPYDGVFLDTISLTAESSLPNLTPYTPTGWDAPIVASSVAGTNTSNSLYAGQSTYIDWAVANNSSQDIVSTFFYLLSIDDTPVAEWYSNSLLANYYASIQDYVQTLSSGWHTLKILADSRNDIVESDETDNEYTQSFYWYDSQFDVSGTMSGQQYPQFYDSSPVISPLPNAYTYIRKGTTRIEGPITTDANGQFSSSTFASTSDIHYVEANTEGTWAKVVDRNGGSSGENVLVWLLSLGPNPLGSLDGSLTVNGDIITSLYYHADRIHTYVSDQLGYTGMDFQMTVYANDSGVDDNGPCYFPNSDEIHFPSNTFGLTVEWARESDVLYHEYGHSIQDKAYGVADSGPDESGMSEGFSDYVAATMNNHPLIGLAWRNLDQGSNPRRYDNQQILSSSDYSNGLGLSDTYWVLPWWDPAMPWNDWGYLHHNAGPSSGALWDMRTNIGNALIADQLFMAAMLLNADSHQELYVDLLLADDDDGDLANGTPHYTQITAAFSRHGITSNPFNLVATYTPQGWDAPIVPSSVTGTTTVGALTGGATTYLDVAVANLTTSNITTPFTTYLYLDDSPILIINHSSGLGAQTYSYVSDFAYVVPAGDHILKTVVDAENGVEEFSESDNSYQQQFHWTGIALPQTVEVKAFLDGPYSGGVMSTALRAGGYIPVTQPFTPSPWNYSGTESVAGIPIGVVDWVLLELRTGTASGTKVATRAAFIKSNGSVVDLDGTSAVSFPSVATGNYYVVLRHRNHLAVMSAAPVAINVNSAQYDFTTGLDKYYGGDAKELTTGVYGLWAGDVTGNGQIKYSGGGNDRLPILTRIGGTDITATVSGYYTEDVNLNGQVKYSGANNDRLIILTNIGGTDITATKLTQVPN